MIYRSSKLALLSVAMFVFGANMAWSDVHTVGSAASGAQFRTITAAMASALVTNADELDLLSDITETGTCIISKQVVIYGMGNYPYYKITLNAPPLQVNRGECTFNYVKFYNSSSTADLVKIQAQHNNINFYNCDFEKGNTSGKLCNDGGTNNLYISGCTFTKGEYGIYISNQYINELSVWYNTFTNCQKGIYYNRTTSAPAVAWVCGNNTFTGGNNYCVYSAIASANRTATFYENEMSAGGATATSYPIYLAGHNDAVIYNNNFYACPANTGSHKAWYNPAGASDNVDLGSNNNSYFNGCVQGNVP